jgi:hypothetical protein
VPHRQSLGRGLRTLVGGIALASAVEVDFRVGRGALGAGLGVFVATLRICLKMISQECRN